MYHNKRKEVGASKCFDIRFGIREVYAFGKLVEWDSSSLENCYSRFWRGRHRTSVNLRRESSIYLNFGSRDRCCCSSRFAKVDAVDDRRASRFARDVYGCARKGKNISPEEIFITQFLSLSLSLCIVILDSNFNRSEETFSNVPNLSFQEEFFSQYYTEYIPNLSRSSFHFRLISSINARVTRDNNNIQHVLRDANVTAPSFSLSLSSLIQSRMRSLYLSPLAFSIAPNSRGKHTGGGNRSLNFRDRWEVHASIGGFIRSHMSEVEILRIFLPLIDRSIGG